ncbi:MAG: hypothetical protein SOZ59_01680 [Candidatus Limivivens sp.]|nr:hypothetical protein [Candidatus Limivivens sp.]
MKKGKKAAGYFLTAVLLMASAVGMTGCSREKLNAQIAESIGTTGKFANNEPVESPKMKAERELQEIQDAKIAKMEKSLEEAKSLADVYDYERALEILGDIEEEFQQDERVVQAKIDYQQKLSKMVAYEGDIPHLYFQTLIVDTEQAFDGDEMESTYNWSFMTAGEFKKILQSLYQKDYVLIDIHEVVGEGKREDGTPYYYRRTPMVPEGKTPLILSQDAVNYYEYLEGDGFAKRLVLDENGEVKALYEDADGQELVGDYDLIPILESFIEEHPDFCLRNARGIIGLTGYQGAFGYRINNLESETLEEDRETVKAIADRLRETGWTFASNTYAGGSLADLSYDAMTEDTDRWLEEIGTYIGEADVLFYPYGADVGFTGDKFEYLLEKGFRYFCGIWATSDYLDVQLSYIHETRRNIDGYSICYSWDSISEFFDPTEVLDPARPGFG